MGWELARALHLWLPRDLAHEVNHSVRILDETEFGTTLLQQIISEGIATAFDQAAFPGRQTPLPRPSRQLGNARCGKR
jgi:uncharacterized protein YjaZ